jgi:hypothetical protein
VDTADYYLMGYTDYLVYVVDPETLEETPTDRVEDFMIRPRATKVDSYPVTTAGRKNTVVDIYDVLGRRLTGYRPRTDARLFAVVQGVNGQYRLTTIP